MSRRSASVVAWSVVGVSAVLGGLGTGMTLAADGFDGSEFLFEEALGMLIFVSAGAVGALIASRLPSNPIGWIFLGLVLALGLSGPADSYIALVADDARPGELAAWAAWYSAKLFIAFFATIFFAVLLFPNGRLPSPRWRPVLWIGSAGLLVFCVTVLIRPGPIDAFPRYSNPAGVDLPGRGALFGLSFVVFAVALAFAAVSLVVRFRQARGIEQQQLKLLMSAGVVAVALFVAGAALESLFGSEKLQAATVIGVFVIPAAIGVAMLRYRLYEVDRVISRTLVYGALTVILGVAYAGLVLVGQAVFSSFAAGSGLAIAGSTLAVAALFLPLRSRVQRFVDRRFYRRRYDAQRTLDGFGARLREEVDLAALAGDLRGVVQETMQPVHVSLWLRSEGRA